MVSAQLNIDLTAQRTDVFRNTKSGQIKDAKGILPEYWELRKSLGWRRQRYEYWYEARQKDNNIQDPRYIRCAHRSDPRCDDAAHHQPTTRPFVEPPMLDYDTFVEKKLPSDKRFRKLLPDDIKR